MNINALFWMDPKILSIATLRSEDGRIICASENCDDSINYLDLDTDLSKLDPYKDYKWSIDWPISKEYLLLIPHSKLQSAMNPNQNDYFFLRGSLAYTIDSSNVGCTYNRRNRKGIESSPKSPFYGKDYGAIATAINNGCKIPDYMLTDNGTKVILGDFLINM
jgi:hypothetical protein